ncbi:alpha/beta hydrolase [Winogradskyella sp.]|uniref:alpha/beta hydrolase n=1 Tax=Winogradskyella sp. TaxID=1883156 RepID=UPI003F6D04FD
MAFILQKIQKRKLKKYVIVLLVLYTMIGSALYLFQEKLLFLPTSLEQDFVYEFDHDFEELFLVTEDDVVINALHFKAENPIGVILYFNGNAGDLSQWGKITEKFVDLKYDVFVMDYRTYGKSTDEIGEIALYNDAQYCYNYLLNQYSENQITLYGRSLGTGLASYLAVNNNPLQLILETPYYSIVDVAKKRFPIFPVKQVLKYQFPNYEYLPMVNCPITILHGTKDSVVPYSSSVKLSELNLDNLEFVTIDNGEHNNLSEFKDYQNAIGKVLK